MSLGGNSTQNIMTYTINADLPPWLIVKWAEENLSPALSRIEGVESVSLAGATPFEWVVTFDANLTYNAGITADDITSALATSQSENIAGNLTDGGEVYTIRLKGAGGIDLENIPVKKVGERIFHLR